MTRKKAFVIKKFASEFVKNGQNASKAYQAIKPVSDHSARVSGSRLLANVDTQKAINDLLPSDSLIAEQVKTAITQQPEHSITWSEKHSYITTALKLRGYLDDTNKGNVNIALVINE